MYAPTGSGQPDFFRCLEVFPGMSRSLVLVVDWNYILDVHVDCVGLEGIGGGSESVASLLSNFQVAGRCRLDNSNAPLWTWTNSIELSSSYLDRIFVGQQIEIALVVQYSNSSAMQTINLTPVRLTLRSFIGWVADT